MNKIEKKLLKSNNLENKLIIFDDGLQDKKFIMTCELCVLIYKLIGNGHLLPSGLLREKLDSLKNNDIVFLKGDLKIQIYMRF